MDDIYVVDDPNDLMETTGSIDQHRNSNNNFDIFYRVVLQLLDETDAFDHEEKENNENVLKYLKIRTHHALAKDGVVPNAESEICVICRSEYEDKENIGTLQCGHDYHTDCIKQWLLKKKDCPICRASALASQE